MEPFGTPNTESGGDGCATQPSSPDRLLRIRPMMRSGKVRMASLVALATMAVIGWRLTAGGPTIEDKRTALYKAVDAGNWKDAYEGLRKIALDLRNDPKKVG